MKETKRKKQREENENYVEDANEEGIQRTKRAMIKTTNL